MQPRQILIVEKNLRSGHGHYPTQIKAISDLFPEAAVSIIAGSEYDGSCGSAIATIDRRSMVRTKIHNRFRFGPNRKRPGLFLKAAFQGNPFFFRTPAYLSALAAAVDSLNLGPSDLVVVPSADLPALEGAICLSEAMGPKAPKFALRYLQKELEEHKSDVRRAHVRSLLNRISDNIRLFCETEETSVYLRERYGLKTTGGFYMPCSVSPYEQLPGRTKSDVFRVGVLGRPRPDKGSGRIAPIVKTLSQRLPKDSRVNGRSVVFAVQADMTDPYERSFYDNIDHHGFIEMYRAGSSETEFRALLSSCDLILLPYDLEIYATRGSGLIQDAVAAGVPIVHTRGMAMQSFLSHGNALSAETPQEFAEAILTVAEHCDAFREGAKHAQAFYQGILLKNPLLEWLDV